MEELKTLQYMDLKSTYNKIAEDWHKDHQSDTWWVEGTDKFVSFLKTEDTILDAGCGGGTKSRYLISKGLRVVGVDFSEKLIEICKREVPEGKFIVLDMGNISALDEKFDGIFAQASLLHIKKKEIKDILRGLNEKLKSGGYLYIAVKEIRAGQSSEEIKSENDYGYEFKRFFSYFTMEELKNDLTGLNMEICYEDRLPVGNSVWLQIIGKKQ